MNNLDELISTIISINKRNNASKSINITRKLKPNESDKIEINKALELYFNSISKIFVDRRIGRSKALVLNDLKSAQILKQKGTLINSFGHRKNKIKTLQPQEILYLLEKNKLEVVWNEIPISLQRAFALFLDARRPNQEQYKIYKTLTNFGFKLVANENCDDLEETSAKRIRLETGKSEKLGDNLDVFEDLRQKGPKKYIPVHSRAGPRWDCDVFLTRIPKKDEKPYRLYYSEPECVNFHKFVDLEEDVPVILGLGRNTVDFYQLQHVDLRPNNFNN